MRRSDIGEGKVGKELINSEIVTRNTYLESKVVVADAGSPVPPVPPGYDSIILLEANVAGKDVYLAKKVTVEHIIS